MVDSRAYQAMSQPVLGIRDAYFLQLLGEIREGLRHVFGTTNHATFPIPASGSGAMEAAVANFVLPGSKLAVFCAGVFAERIAAMGVRHGATVVRQDKSWGEVFTEDEAEEFISKEKPEVVAFVQAETSTGAFQSGRAIVRSAKRNGALVIADAVTSLGAMPVELDEVGIDVAFSCAQKGLSCPAGLSPFTASRNAWEWLSRRAQEPDSWYLDLRLLAKYYDPPHVYHHTPAPPLCYALHQGLAVIAEEGLRERWQRHLRAGERLWAGLERLGFSFLVADPRNRIWHMTTVFPPSGTNEADLRQRLLDRYDIEIASGLGQLAGKILRIGTMGPLANEADVEFLLQAIGDCL